MKGNLKMKQDENSLCQFTNEEKIAGFNLIAEQYFDRNFGTMSKTDFETLLFSIYIEHCLDNHLPFDDYALSKSLGITQSKVRNLKVKKELQYPKEGFAWKDAFVERIKYAHYDSVKHLVKVNIPDVNVMLELRHHLEKHSWYDEYQLNPKLFQCKTDIFILLCQSLDEDCKLELDEETKTALKKLKVNSKSENEQFGVGKILSGSVEEGLKEIAVNGSQMLLMEVLKLLPFGSFAGSAINFVIEVLKNSLNT